MFGFWAKADPTCGKRKRSTGDAGTQEAKKSLITPQNSSGNYPYVSRLHNEAERDAEHPSLLSMPTNVMVTISRLVVIPNEQIMVSTKDPSWCQQPPLLVVCRQIREVARPVFYRQNNFELMVYDFNVKGLLPWRNMRDATAQAWPFQAITETRYDFMAMTKSKRMQVCSTKNGDKHLQSNLLMWQKEWKKKLPSHDVPMGTHTWNIDCALIDWQNLVNWLQLFHSNEVESYVIEDYFEVGLTSSLKHRAAEVPELLAVASAFELVGSLKQQPWTAVEKLLPAIRGLLSAVDRRWAKDFNEAANTEEGAGGEDGDMDTDDYGSLDAAEDASTDTEEDASMDMEDDASVDTEEDGSVDMKDNVGVDTEEEAIVDKEDESADEVVHENYF